MACTTAARTNFVSTNIAIVVAPRRIIGGYIPGDNSIIIQYTLRTSACPAAINILTAVASRSSYNVVTAASTVKVAGGTAATTATTGATGADVAGSAAEAAAATTAAAGCTIVESVVII